MTIRFLLVISAIFPLVSRVSALPMDQDGDGIPDVWEIVYGLPVLADAPHAGNHVGMLADAETNEWMSPTDDLDGDGKNTLQEAAEGTDPRSFELGIGRSGIVSNQSVSSSALSILAKVVPGKHYSLSRTTDHVSWTTVAQATSTSSTDLSLYTVNANASSGRQIYYYNLQISDVDSDGDGLTDYEENILGFNVNGPTDLNSNGINDEIEFLSQDLVHSPLHTVTTLGSKAANSSKTAEIFSSYNTTTGTATLNSNCWAAGYDFSGVEWGHDTTGTVITHGHMITVNHYTTGYPTTVNLVGKTTGAIYSIGVQSYQIIPNEDLRLIRMVDADVAAMEAVEGPLTVYPLLPARKHDEWLVMLRDGNAQFVSDANRPLAIQTEWHNRRALPVAISGITFHIEGFQLQKPVSQYSQFYEDLNPGDSGHPIFFPTTTGKLALIGVNQGGGTNASTAVPLFRSSIQEAIEAKVAADGFHLTYVDPATL